MVFVPALGVAKAELRFLASEQKVENTLFFYLGTAPTDGAYTDLGAALISWWKTELRGITSNLVSLNEVFITDLSGPTAPTWSFTDGLPSSGTSSHAGLPNNVTLAISFRTHGRGRSSRGRNYLVGLCEDQVVGSTVTTSHANDIVAAYNQLLSPSPYVGTAVWSVVSTQHNKAPRTNAVVLPITNALCVDTTVDSQRRRLPGRGR